VRYWSWEEPSGYSASALSSFSPRCTHNSGALPAYAMRFVTRSSSLLPDANIEQAHAVLRALFGPIRVVGDEQEIRFEVPTCERHSWLCCGLQEAKQINIVAGAGFATRLPRFGCL
jgi:hypothetical protein